MVDQQPDLFGNSQGSAFEDGAVPGLSYRQDFLQPEEQPLLVAAIGTCPMAPFRFRGWSGHRHTASFGWRYDFDRGALQPADPMPDGLAPIRSRAEAFAGLSAGALVQALLIHYPPGAGIGWHRDRPAFGEVIGISLGAPAILRLRRRSGERRFERAAQPLAPGSIYRLAGAARHAWEHGIAPLDAPRWSITFRTLAARRDG